VRFSPLVDRLAGRGSSAWRIHFEAVQRRDKDGQDVILLTVGDPDQKPPAAMVEALVDSLRSGHTGYAAIVGPMPLREAIAKRVTARTGTACTAENVVIVPGAQAGLFCSLQLLAGPGDEVILAEPMYATYEAVVGVSGATLVTVPLKPENNFHPDLKALAAAITPRTRVLWINSPHNPTGAVLDRAELEAIAELCRRYDLWLLSDEVYEDLAYARPHISPRTLPGMAERTLVISSLSKSHAVPGFRTGWIICPAAMTPHLFNLILCMTYGGPPFIHDGALPALTSDLPEAAALRADYQRRAALLGGILKTARNCRVVMPEGGMFLLLDVRGTGLSATDFARGLLNAENVALLPADGFGPSLAGHLRVSLTQADTRLKEAGERIVRYAAVPAAAPALAEAPPRS
jgi:arginine:pyruvate transaminase